MTAPTQPVTVRFFDQDGTPIAARVSFKLTCQEVYQGIIVAAQPDYVTCDATTGIGVINLFPNALGANSSQYTVKAVDSVTGRKVLVETLCTVPDSPCYLDLILNQDPFPTVDAAGVALIAAQAATATATTQADIATAKAVLTAADAASTAADVVLTHADASTASAAKDAAQIAEIAAATHDTAAALSRLNAQNSQLAAAASAATAIVQADAAAADVILTHADVVLTHADVASIADDAATSAANASTASTQAGIATEQAGIATAVASDFVINLAIVAGNLVTTQATLAYHIAHHP